MKEFKGKFIDNHYKTIYRSVRTQHFFPPGCLTVIMKLFTDKSKLRGPAGF